jgi:hypothetical protein
MLAFPMKSAPQPGLSTPSSRAKPVHLLSFFPSFDATRPNLFSTDPGAYFAAPLFSYSYELLLPQALYFDNDPHCPGGRGVTPSSVAPSSTCLCRNSPLFKHLQTLCFSLRSFPHSDRLFSITSALFSQNTRGGGAQHFRATLRFRRHMHHVTPLSPIASVDCTYFPSPRGYGVLLFGVRERQASNL